ncbi:type I polyketide synthase [Thermohalobaculum xanthum]|uniref:type I polyketide synthase n=1 Tax=Thermohalobaculum xanthum TaxID=2753746 RepID=UPI001F33CC52|nr:type I polyketide synthase [Thermohalobaculum xanthum]
MTSRHDRELVEIAISGLACRLPGASDPAEFWRLLSEERVSIAPIPPDRWNARRFLHPDRRMAGRSYTMSAGLIDGIWEFDPGFFGISAREAAQMDPQQRILLEVAYEAIDAACLKPEILSEGRTGVYVGASSMDHSQRFAADPAAIGAQFMTGNTLSILSNRISHAFDLKGPSYTVDTACSSSFYALDHAVRALADGEIDTAIVGGVNAILQPYNFVGFSRASMLSPTGLCRAFDAAADGYVRAEGAVALVLRRLESARAEGEPVRAVLMGTGVNSDGRTMGLALPSGERQAALLETVYRRLGIEPDRLAFIEAHGTGTPVGDPIEAHAIGKVLGKGRARPLPIGSAKSNVGHLEPASGLVGLIKAALALENGTVPRSLHVEQVNPHIPLDDLGLQVATEALPVPPHPDGAPWVAGINNFGFGGANAHAVLREALPAERPASPPEPLTSQASLPPLILTAASGESLARQAAAWSARVAGTSAAEATALIATAAHRQARHRHRAVVLGDTVSALVTELDSLGAGTSLVNTAVATAADRAGQTAFVFSGNGAQWPGMGCDLYAGDAAFRAAFDRVADAFRAQSGTDDPTSDLADLLQDPELGARIEESEVAQPLIFAIQVALVEALAGRGVRPDAVAGHSVGEVAAAWAAGALSLEDAVRLIRVRARAVRPLAGRGGMAAVLASAETVQGMLDELGMQAEISVAGDNSPRSVTICGDADALDRFGHSARKRRIAVRRLAVAYPYHGPAIDEIRDELLSGLAELAPRPAKLAFVSTTTGARAEGECLGATHWWHNARDAVRFRGAVGALDEVGCTVFVEIGPRPVLPSYVGDTLDGLGRAGAVLGTIEGPGKSATIDMMAARAVACGARVDAERFFGPPLPARHDRPAYSWDHATHRVPATSEELDVLGSAIDHPLLGWRPWHGEGTWRAQLDVASLPWLGDHAIEGSAVMPAAGFAEIALAAGAESLGTRALELSDFDIVSPLVFEAPGLVTLRTELERETGIVRIESRPSGSTDDWRLHARGTIRRAPGGANLPLDDATDDAAPVGRLAWTGERLYRMLAQAGLEYGPAFQLVTSLSADGPGAISELAEADAAPGANFVLHPASLDAAFHALFPLVGRALREQGLPEEGSFLPIRLGRLTTFAQPEPAEAGSVIRHAQVELVRLTEYGAEAAITLGNAQQTPIARIEGMRLRRVRSRRRLRDTPIAWAETLVPLAEPGAAVPVPDGWSAPRERLHGLGIIPEADQAPEPDAGALIADAAARRIAWDAVESLAGASRQIDRNGGSSVHPSARSLFARVAGVLEADGGLLAVASDTMTGEPETETKAAVTPSSGVLGLARDCPYPPLDALIEALIAEAPERAADLASLTRLAACLEPALRDGLDDDARAAAPGHLASHAPARRALWAAIERMGLDLGGSWPMGDRLALLVLGDVPPDVAARLAGLPGLTRLVLSDPEREVSERLALALSSQTATRVAHWDALEGPFDVVLSGDALWRVDNPARAPLRGPRARRHPGRRRGPRRSCHRSRGRPCRGVVERRLERRAAPREGVAGAQPDGRGPQAFRAVAARPERDRGHGRGGAASGDRCRSDEGRRPGHDRHRGSAPNRRCAAAPRCAASRGIGAGRGRGIRPRALAARLAGAAGGTPSERGRRRGRGDRAIVRGRDRHRHTLANPAPGRARPAHRTLPPPRRREQRWDADLAPHARRTPGRAHRTAGGPAPSFGRGALGPRSRDCKRVSSLHRPPDRHRPRPRQRDGGPAPCPADRRAGTRARTGDRRRRRRGAAARRPR